MRRRGLAILAVCLLVVTAGCTALFGGPSEETIDERPPNPYEWNTSTDVAITVHGNGTYQAVYNLSSAGTDRLELFQRGLGSDEPLPVRSVRYRYPNGTVVNGSEPPVSIGVEGSKRVIAIDRENASGMLAYTASSPPKEFSTPGFVEGSYEVVLPADHRVSSFLFGDVSPPESASTVDDRGRLHLTWDSVESDVFVRYYLARDVLIFRGLVAVLAVFGAAGMLYYYRKIRRLEEKREELGLDVDTDPDDDFGDGPPPGMR